MMNVQHYSQHIYAEASNKDHIYPLVRKGSLPVTRGKILIHRLSVDPDVIYYLYVPLSAKLNAPVMVAVHGIQRRADLEGAISGLKSQISDAIAKKDFKQASTLQGTLDELELLREEFPSIDELRSTLAAEQKALETAIAGAKYSEADRLHQSIDRIEKKLATEIENAVENAEGADDDDDDDRDDEESICTVGGSRRIITSRHGLEEEHK